MAPPLPAVRCAGLLRHAVRGVMLCSDKESAAEVKGLLLQAIREQSRKKEGPARKYSFRQRQKGLMSESITSAASPALITLIHKQQVPPAAPSNTSRQVGTENSETGTDSGLTWILKITALFELGKCPISGVDPLELPKSSGIHLVFSLTPTDVLL